MLAGVAVFSAACDMALVQADAEIEEVCVTRSISSFGPRAPEGGMEVAVDLARTKHDLDGGLDSDIKLVSAGFLASDVDSLGFLDRLELQLRGGGSRVLPIMSRSFEQDASPVVVNDFAPAVDVTDYLAADDGALLVTVDGSWERRKWGADLDLCFSVEVGYVYSP